VTVCPECGYKGPFYKDGLRHLPNGDLQRWLCRSCGYRFSESNQQIQVFRKVHGLKPSSDLTEARVSERDFSIEKVFNNGSFTFGKDVRSHNLTNLGKGSNTFLSYYSNGNYALKDAKKLSATETKTVAGKSQQDIQGQIVTYLWYLTKEGRKPLTIVARRKALLRLVKHGANLYDPEQVKDVIARETVSTNTKLHYVTAYDGFLKWLNIPWKAPKYKFERKLPWLPTEAELDQLIAGFKRKTATFLQVAKETYARAGEIWTLKWIDLNGNILTVNLAEKGSNPRQFKISEKLVSMLNALPHKDQRIFGPTVSLANFRTGFMRKRKGIAQTLANPRLNKITFHTFRHWGATMLFAKTKNILYVKQQLGHRCIENTMVYTQLINFENDEWHVGHAKTLDEEDKFIQAGFEFVRYDQNESVSIYRKRK
jgi:integrase